MKHQGTPSESSRWQILPRFITSMCISPLNSPSCLWFSLFMRRLQVVTNFKLHFTYFLNIYRLDTMLKHQQKCYFHQSINSMFTLYILVHLLFIIFGLLVCFFFPVLWATKAKIQHRLNKADEWFVQSSTTGKTKYMALISGRTFPLKPSRH